MGVKDHTGRSTEDRQVFGKGQVLWINKFTFMYVKCFCFLLLYVIFLTRTLYNVEGHYSVFWNI